MHEMLLPHCTGNSPSQQVTVVPDVVRHVTLYCIVVLEAGFCTLPRTPLGVRISVGTLSPVHKVECDNRPAPFRGQQLDRHPVVDYHGIPSTNNV